MENHSLNTDKEFTCRKKSWYFYWPCYIHLYYKYSVCWVLYQTHWITCISKISVKCYLKHWLAISKVGIKTFVLCNLEFPNMRQQVSKLQQNCLAWKCFEYINTLMRQRSATAQRVTDAFVENLLLILLLKLSELFWIKKALQGSQTLTCVIGIRKEASTFRYKNSSIKWQTLWQWFSAPATI